MKNKLKISKRLIILLIISLIIPISILADTVAFKTVVTKNDMVVSGDFWLDVQMQITAGTSPRTLNSLTADVYFGNEISYASADNWAYSFLDGYSPSTNDLTTYIRVGTTGNNVNISGGGNPAGWNVTTSWQTVVTLKFTIATATSVNISINDATDAAAYFNNIANNPSGAGVTDWTVTNEDSGDVTLPVILTAFTSEYTISDVGEEFVSVNWTTASETDVLGFNIYRSDNEIFSTSEKINNEIISGTNTQTTHDYTYSDQSLFNEEVLAGDVYWYWLETVELGGNIYVYIEPAQLIIPDDYNPPVPPELPLKFGLYQNCPNPFNPYMANTKICFYLGEGTNANVEIKVYNIRGELVKTIWNQYTEFIKRPVLAVWDGCNENGKAQANGIYFYKMSVDGVDKEINKMIILK